MDEKQHDPSVSKIWKLLLYYILDAVLIAWVLILTKGSTNERGYK